LPLPRLQAWYHSTEDTGLLPVATLMNVSDSPLTADMRKIGLVLSGGGGRGAYQIGCWKALLRAGLARVTVISGTSVGALNGALIAQGDFDRAAKIWTDLKEQHVLRAVYWWKYSIGATVAGMAAIVTFLAYIPLLILFALFACSIGAILYFRIIDNFGARLFYILVLVVSAFLVLLMYKNWWGSIKRDFKKHLRTVSVRLGRFLWVGTNEPLRSLTNTNINTEKLRQSGIQLFATISVLEEYWDPFTPKFLTALPEREEDSTLRIDPFHVKDPFEVSRSWRASLRPEPKIPLIVDRRWIPGPFKGWLPKVIEITALKKDEDVCSALLESGRLPLVFERGAWIGQVALDGGVADLTPLLPVLEAGCE
jgi:hypothetical protein